MERKTKKNYSPLRILTFSSSGRWWVWIIEALCLNAYFFFVVFSTCLCVETKNRGPISRSVLQSNGIFSLLRSVTHRAFHALKTALKTRLCKHYHSNWFQILPSLFCGGGEEEGEQEEGGGREWEKGYGGEEEKRGESRRMRRGVRKRRWRNEGRRKKEKKKREGGGEEREREK